MSNGDITSELAEKADFSALYMEMYENNEFAESLYTEISDMLYAEHIEIDKARQTAHETGLPYDEYPYDPEENFDPYAYNPNRMSDEDYNRMHDLIDKERAEAENLKGREVRIDDRAYYIEDFIWHSARPETKLRAVYDSLDPIKYNIPTTFLFYFFVFILNNSCYIIFSCIFQGVKWNICVKPHFRYVYTKILLIIHRFYTTTLKQVRDKNKT